jgi:thiamine biosynthesis lipoprotein
MMMKALTRRRFFKLMACAAGVAILPGSARAATWHGRAFGSDVSFEVEGGEPERAIEGVLAIIRNYEQAFSLHDPDSEISRINREKVLIRPSDLFRTKMRQAEVACITTLRLFDPTVQTVWEAITEGVDVDDARKRVSFSNYKFHPGEPRLLNGCSITMNGMVQGSAADDVGNHLRSLGYARCLVDMGELAAVGEGWSVGVADPAHGMLARITLADSAVATSSPHATLLRGEPHIISPFGGAPQWSSVTVESPLAASADMLSTVLSIADAGQAAHVVRRYRHIIKRALAVDFDGNLQTLA